MNSRSTLPWLLVAAALFVAVFLHHRYGRKTAKGPERVLPSLNAVAVTQIQVHPRGKLEIRVNRTNDHWQMSQPLSYLAQSSSITNFLKKLEGLTAATYIPPREYKDRAKADDQFGMGDPQSSIFLQQGDSPIQILVGLLTSPGDQVFLQQVGVDGIYVVDAEILKYIPRDPDEWRDTAFVKVSNFAFDRISVTNGAKFFELQNDRARLLWQFVTPLPMRANNVRIEEALGRLQSAQITAFIAGSPKADAEVFGLQPPELELTLRRGTNEAKTLQFGKAVPGNTNQVYAREPEQSAVVTVPLTVQEAWRASLDQFRDPHLVALTAPIQEVEVQAGDHYEIRPAKDALWMVEPQNLVADPMVVKELLTTLSEMKIVEYVKDLVTTPGLGEYGLTPPSLQYILKKAVKTPSGQLTNQPLVDLAFGTNDQGKVFARCSDENSVYSIQKEDYDKLLRISSSSWQLRNRQVANVDVEEISRVTVQSQGKTRQMARKGPYQWSLAAGSQGIVQDLPVEETVKGLCKLMASAWVGKGEGERARFGLVEGALRVTLETKTGTSQTIEFGGESRTGFQYAATQLDHETWIFELTWPLYRDVETYLAKGLGTP